MPRPLVYANGSFLIAFDERHRARDLFWPTVGHPNHLLGHKMRVGVWRDGEFSWCDSSDWDLELKHEGSLWRCWKLGLEIGVREAVDPASPVFTRRLTVTDLRGSGSTIRLFFSQNFILGQSDVGNTALYHPHSDSVVHYRGPHVAACSASAGSPGIAQYATGITGFENLEGTWRDAEDGELSMNPIAQGSVDSTFSVELALAAMGSAVVDFSLRMADRIDTLPKKPDPDHVVKSAEAESTLWLDSLSLPNLGFLSARAQSLFQRSLLVIRTQIDHGGAILAANDSDILATNRATYSYCWPRDGALVAQGLAKVGAIDHADRFMEFCRRVFPCDHPFFLQKYRSDGSLGASWHPWIRDGKAIVPFQQDETALTLLAMSSASREAAHRAWETFGKRSADFLVENRGADGLPLPSYDLWEERWGTHFYTACATVAGLRAASSLTDEARYREAADQMVEAIDEGLWSEASQTYARCNAAEADTTPDSALIGGILLLEQGELRHEEQAVMTTADSLRIDSPFGGLARYKGDYYFRRTDDFPGNPWVISTLWFAQWLARSGEYDQALSTVEAVSGWATASGVLAEQYHPETGEPLSVSPLTWSHSEYVAACLELSAGTTRSGAASGR